MKNVMPSGQVEHRLSNTKTADGNDGRSETILFRRDDNGKLQLCCNDPSVLQVEKICVL